jgi:hypothetical protein
LDIPSFDFRREILCRDPLAPVLAVKVAVRLILAGLLGLRMCGNCPDCECCNEFGSNAKPTGGVFGLCCAMVGAVENQFLGTLHYHALCYLANIYQYNTLQEIASAIEEGKLLASAVQEWHCWVHREEHFHLNKHEASLAASEKSWKNNNRGPENDALCALPKYLQRPASPRTLWDSDISMSAAEAEGAAFTQQYMADAQGVFSRVHHHWHPGGVPLDHCLAKKTRWQPNAAQSKAKTAFASTAFRRRFCEVLFVEWPAQA